MYLTLLTLSGSLLSQVAVEAPLVPVQSAQGRLSPADLVAQALALPDGASLTGQPLTLVKALSSAEDGRRQLEVAHAYWRLSLAVAEYRLRLEEYGQLGQISPGAEDALMFETARTSAAAALRLAKWPRFRRSTSWPGRPCSPPASLCLCPPICRTWGPIEPISTRFSPSGTHRPRQG